MADDLDRLNARLARRRRWAGCVLRFEHVLVSFAPLLLEIGVFVGLSLLDVWRAIPFWAHVAGLLAFAGLLAVAGWHGVRRLRRGADGDVDRRLETAAGLAHQPLLSHEDRLSDRTDTVGRRLWAAHLARQRRALASLPFIGAAPILARHDPRGLRVALALLLVVAVVDAGPTWRERLVGALLPQPAEAIGSAPLRLDVWLTPPVYTGEPPIVRTATLPLDPTDAEPVVVPAGSELVVQLHDAAGRPPPRPSFALDELTTETLGPGSIEARVLLHTSGTLDVPGPEPEVPAARLAIEVVPDMAPTVRFLEIPRATHRRVLNPSYAAADDHGLAAIDLDLALAARPEARERVAVRQLARPVKTLEEGSFLDLTPHPFAGQEVTASLVATDVAGQEGVSEPLVFVLPERVFQNPLAQAIIGMRKELVAQPSERPAIASKLNLLAQSPRLESMEVVIPLSLRAASTRLVLADEGDADRSVVDLLWELALYVEDGRLSVAERDLRALEQALMEALERGAGDEEIQALMDELQQALNAFLDALQQQALEQMRDMPPGDEAFRPVDPNAQVMDRQDIQQMMDELRDALESGARQQAEEMLAQLRQLLENLQTTMQMPMMSPMQQNMGDLQELIRRQQELLDQSFQAQQNQQGLNGQQGQQGQTGQGQMGQGEQGPSGQPTDEADMSGLGAQQEALRRALGELMRQLGEMGQDIPRALGQSELQMRGAEQALGQGQPGAAIGPQTEALDLLQQGAGQLMEQMQQQLGQQPGQPGPNAGMGPPLDETRDPLGRPLRNDGGASPYGVEVPDQPDLGTARDVLRELHRRSGEDERPALELDYFERLLRRF